MKTMNIVYLSRANLLDRLFFKDFIFNFKFKTPTLIFHATLGEGVGDTLAATKRISSMMSEALVYNNAFLAAQRSLFKKENQEITVNKERIEYLLKISPVLIIGPVIIENQKEVSADPLLLVQAARSTWNAKEIILFPDNPLSLMGTKKPLVETPQDVENLRKIYEEENQALNRAYELRPARICSSVNYSWQS